MTLRFGPSPKAVFKARAAHNERLAKALAEAIQATREPEREATIYFDDMTDLSLCLFPLIDVLADVFGTLDKEKSQAECLRTGRGVFELKNGSAIVLRLKERSL